MSRYLQFMSYLLTLFLLTCIVSCKRDSPKDTILLLDSFSPEQGSEGGTVVLTGKNFSSDKERNLVKFNGVDAVVTEVVNDGTSLSVIVPENATTGKITVKVGDQEVASGKDFVVNPLAPSMTQFTPDKGAGGTIVVITGNNFKAPVKVFFGQLEGQEMIVVNKNRIEVKAPANVITGKIRVLCNGLETLSVDDFYGAPTASTIAPRMASVGQELLITGTNFDPVAANNTVKFGNAVATVLAGSGINQLKVHVPVGATNGRVSITVRGMTTSTTDEFQMGAVITDFSPKHGEPGSIVTISGRNFATNASVRIGNTACAVLRRDEQSITFTLPEESGLKDNKFVLTSNSSVVETATAFEVTNVWKNLISTGFPHIGGASFVIDNRIFVAGGISSSHVDEFDLSTNSWKRQADLPAGIAMGSGGKAMVLNNKVYMGNFFVTDNRATWYQYDPMVTGPGAWKRMTDYPTDNGNAGFAVNINNKLYYGLGSDYIVSFDPSGNNGNGVWGTRNVPACNNRATVWSFVINGLGYFGGGFNSRAVDILDAHAFHPEAGPHLTTPIAPILRTSRHAPAYAINGKGYVIIGNTVYEYSPAINSWSILKFTIPVNVHYAVAINNTAYSISSSGAVYKFVPNR